MKKKKIKTIVKNSLFDCEASVFVFPQPTKDLPSALSDNHIVSRRRDFHCRLFKIEVKSDTRCRGQNRKSTVNKRKSRMILKSSAEK